MRDFYRKFVVCAVLFFSCAALLQPGYASQLQDSDLPASGVLRATNPVDQSRISAVWVDSSARTGPKLVFAASTDGGAWWEPQPLQFPSQCTQCDLVSLDIDLLGRSHILFTAAGAHDSDGGLYVYSTKDDGKTFWNPGSPARIFVNNQNGVASAPALVVNLDQSDHAFKNHIVVAWVTSGRPNGGTPYSEILVAISVNGGSTFSYPPVPVGHGKNNDDLSAPAIFFGNQGKIQITWTEQGGGTRTFENTEAAILFTAALLRKQGGAADPGCCHR